ncbi:peptidase C69 [candidate division KSB1 bacterium]|nr:MAG: peptidase C69 [candidate division KSB1 bacterium]
MGNKKNVFVVILCFLLLVFIFPAVKSQDVDDCGCQKAGCSSFAAGPGATVEGYAMSGHTCDGNCDFTLKVIPGGTHKPGEKVNISYPGLPGGFKHVVFGETDIPQVLETYTFFMCECPIGNEHQVFFGENTCWTRKELRNLPPGKAMLDYTQVAALALQRGKTAREAILAAGRLIEKYGLKGLGGSGESFLVSDPNEAWCFEVVGESTLWVAQRIPYDHVCPHANRMRIGVVNPDDRENFMMSPGLIQNAIDKGFYDPEKDGPFNFAKVYSGNQSRGNKIREWRMFSLLCPSKKWEIDQEFPFSVKPDKKISAKWWINNVWRDHLEGTPYDKTQGMAAGPFNCPGRFRISGLKSERSICTAGSGYTWVSQARKWLPDCIGGVVWFGLDCPRSTIYVPFYVGISQTPESWHKGDFTKFDPDSPRWYFQAIDTFSWLRYRDIHADVRKVFDAIENEEFDKQAKIEKVALELYKSDPELAREFLTSYSTSCALKAEKAAKNMFYNLIAKYSDGRPRTKVSEKWLEILNKK